MSKTNEQVGTVPCPVKGCTESCAVRKFAQRAQRETGRRVAGRMYFDCPNHGRFGFDGKPAMQEYILEHGDIWGATKPEPAPSPPPAPSPSPAPPKPPEPGSVPAKKPGGFGFFG